MKKFNVRLFVALAVAALGFVSANRALAVTVPINFTGTEQDFNATVDLSGNLFADGQGTLFGAAFKLTPPLNHPLSLVGGPVNITSDPKTDPLGTTFDISPGALTNMNDLDLDLLNGQTTGFAINPIVLTTDNAFVNALLAQGIKISGILSDLRFTQTGAAALLGGGGNGTFSVAGDLSATIDNLNANVANVTTIAIGTQNVNLPYSLTGSWTLSGSPANTKIELDGSTTLAVPISVATALATAVPGLADLTASLDLAASLNITFNYHLEQSGIVIPEPGSLVLLGLGLLAFAPLAARRIRR